MQVPASDGGRDERQEEALGRTRGEEMLEAYRAQQRTDPPRTGPSFAPAPDGQPRSQIPVRSPPPSYMAVLRSRQQDHDLGLEAFNGAGDGGDDRNVSHTHSTLQHSSWHFPAPLHSANTNTAQYLRLKSFFYFLIYFF